MAQQSNKATASVTWMSPEPDIKEPPVKEEPKTEVDILIERLKAEKPQTYEVYVNALKAQKRAWIYPDLTIRVG